MTKKERVGGKKRTFLLLSFLLVLGAFFYNSESVSAFVDDAYWDPNTGRLRDPNVTEDWDFYESIYNSGSRRLAGNTRIQTAEMVFDAYQSGNENATSIVLYPGRDSLWMDAINAVPFAHAIDAPMLALPLSSGVQVYGNQGSFNHGGGRVTRTVNGYNGEIVTDARRVQGLNQGSGRNAVATPDVIETIGRLNNLQRIYIAGGNVPNGAIPNETRLFLESEFGVEVVELMGPSLWATTIDVANILAREVNHRNAAVLVSREENGIWDGISAVTQAARYGYPIFFADSSTNIRAAVVNELNRYNRVYVVGGENTIGNSALNGINRPITRIDGTGRDTGTRNWGTNRYATNLEALDYFDSSPDHLFVANGNIVSANSTESGLEMGSTSFSDTVSGSIVAAQNDAGVLLLRGGAHNNQQLLQSQINYLTDDSQYYYRMTFLGGPASLSRELRQEVEDLFGQTDAIINQHRLEADRSYATLNIGGQNSQSGIRDVRFRAVGGRALAAYGRGWRIGWTPNNNGWFNNPQRSRSIANNNTIVEYNGQYEVEVRDRYNADNTFTARVNITGIDDNDPNVNITQTPTGWTNGNVTLRVQATDNLSNDSGIAQIRHVSGGNISGTRTRSYNNVRSATGGFTATQNGTYTFEVTDRTGNTTTETHTVTNIDRGRPNINVSGPTGWSNSNVTLQINARDFGAGNNQTQPTHTSGVEQLTVRRPDGSIWTHNYPSNTQRNTGWVGNVHFTATQHGTYQISVRDRAGNSHSVSRTVQIDRTNPTISVSQTPTGWTKDNVQVNWTANVQGNSDLARVRFHDGNSWSGWENTSGRSRSFSRTVTSNRTVRMEVENQAGNTFTQSHHIENIDGVAPELDFTHNPRTWTNQNVTTTIRARDGGPNDGPRSPRHRVSGIRRMRMRRQGGSWSSWDNYGAPSELSTSWYNRTRTITENGTYDVQLEDRAGNVRNQTFTVDWIDRANPVVRSSQSPINWTNGDVAITWRGESRGGSPIHRIRMHDGNSWGGWQTYNSQSFSQTQRVSRNGTYRIQVEDQAGNIVEDTHTVSNIDVGSPDIRVGQRPTGWTNEDITITWTGTRTGGPGAPLRRFRYDRGGGDWTEWQDAPDPDAFDTTQIVNDNGDYHFEVEDEAGNTGTSTVTITQFDDVAPVGNITAQYDRTEPEVINGETNNVDMIDSNTVTVDVTEVEDLGISGVAYIIIEEQRRIGYDGSWTRVDDYQYDWPDPYDVSEQTYDIDVAHAQDTRFVLTVHDRAGNVSGRVTSNVVRHSVLQSIDFEITDVVNPELTPEQIKSIRETDLTTESAPLTAGTNATFDFTYQLRHLDDAVSLVGNILVVTESPDGELVGETVIQVNEAHTGHNQNVTVTESFRVPEGAPHGSTVNIFGHLVAEMENGTQHEIFYPNADTIGAVGNHFEEFFRFRLIR